jgi:HAMP domain-containing protein
MGLRMKFNLAMGITFLAGLVIAGLLSYRLAQRDALREVLQQASVMAGQASVLSDYTAREIAPLLADQSRQQFLPQSVPFWVSHTNFSALQKLFPDYSVRMPALNPTNPADRPTDWQAEIIGLFRDNPALREHVSQRPSPGGPILSISRPIRVEDGACLECHSTPAAAPAAMVDLYGPENGFGWKLGETVGAQIVSVPMRVALERAARTFQTVMVGLCLVFLLMTVLLNLLLHGMIIRRVRRISAAANEVSLGNMDAPELPVAGRDEIASLTESFNRMRRSFANAMRLLER